MLRPWFLAALVALPAPTRPAEREARGLRLVATDALAPPVTRRDVAARPGARDLTALALPGTAVRWGLTLLAPEDVEVTVAEPVLAGPSGQLAVTARWVLAWEQRDALNPERAGHDRRELVRELLVRRADRPLAAPGGGWPRGLQDAGPPRATVAAGEPAPLLLKVVVPAGTRPGRLSGVLGIRAAGHPPATVNLEVEVLADLPAGPAFPVGLFYRGRLPETEALAREGRWPEVVTESELLRDARLLRELGVTHVTSFARPPVAARMRSLFAEAGFAGELIEAGWPRPQRRLPAESVRTIVGHVRATLDDPRAATALFYLGDEPVAREIEVMAGAAVAVLGAGGRTLATVRSEAAVALRDVLDVPVLDATERPRRRFVRAVHACRAVGAEPWQYWQSWPEDGHAIRWWAGFGQLEEPTRGYLAYAFAHAFGSPWDDFDAPLKDAVMVVPGGDGVLTHTLQLEAFQAGVEDLATWHRVNAWVVGRADAEGTPRVSALARHLRRVRLRYQASRCRDWARHDPGDVARPGPRRGPPAGALERARQDLLSAWVAARAHPDTIPEDDGS